MKCEKCKRDTHETDMTYFDNKNIYVCHTCICEIIEGKPTMKKEIVKNFANKNKAQKQLC